MVAAHLLFLHFCKLVLLSIIVEKQLKDSHRLVNDLQWFTVYSLQASHVVKHNECLEFEFTDTKYCNKHGRSQLTLHV